MMVHEERWRRLHWSRVLTSIVSVVAWPPLLLVARTSGIIEWRWLADLTEVWWRLIPAISGVLNKCSQYKNLDSDLQSWSVDSYSAVETESRVYAVTCQVAGEDG